MTRDPSTTPTTTLSFPQAHVSCLTKEEECMMKTALAFVVAKARLRPRKRPLEPEKDGELTIVSNASSSTVNQFYHGIANRSKASRPRPSVLDCIFHPKAQLLRGGSAAAGLDCPTASLLQRNGGTHHLDHMFQAAFNLAKCAILQNKTRCDPDSGHGSANSNTNAALIGATAHLAHQLEVLLSTTLSPSTESSSCRSQEDDVEGKTSTREAPQPPTEYDGMTIVQSWIRSTLLHFAASSNMSSVSSKAISTDDIEAAFGVYQILVPQLAVLSPPVIAHIFQVVTRLIRELYDDKLILPDVETSAISNSSKRNITITELDSLATSALKLLELCWTVDTGNPTSCIESQLSHHRHDEQEHRSFLILCLQETLGDLLIPLSHDEVVSSAQQSELVRDTRHEKDSRLTLARGATTPVTIEASPTYLSNDSKQNNEGRRNTMIHQQCYLDPEAKLIMRMAVYRLLMLK